MKDILADVSISSPYWNGLVPFLDYPVYNVHTQQTMYNPRERTVRQVERVWWKSFVFLFLRRVFFV